MTFESFVKIYENDIKPKLKLNTWLTKESIIDKKIVPYFKNRKLSDIKPNDITKEESQLLFDYRHLNEDKKRELIWYVNALKQKE